MGVLHWNWQAKQKWEFWLGRQVSRCFLPVFCLWKKDIAYRLQGRFMSSSLHKHCVTDVLWRSRSEWTVSKSQSVIPRPFNLLPSKKTFAAACSHCITRLNQFFFLPACSLQLLANFLLFPASFNWICVSPCTSQKALRVGPFFPKTSGQEKQEKDSYLKIVSRICFFFLKLKHLYEEIVPKALIPNKKISWSSVLLPREYVRGKTIESEVMVHPFGSQCSRPFSLKLQLNQWRSRSPDV